MKPTAIEQQQEHQRCDAACCPNCTSCRVINIDGTAVEVNAGAPQLYDKEAENYFFYYALNARQSS